jgi:hypothetical protein
MASRTRKTSPDAVPDTQQAVFEDIRTSSKESRWIHALGS